MHITGSSYLSTFSQIKSYVHSRLSFGDTTNRSKCTHPRGVYCAPSLTQRCCLGILPQRHRGAGTVEFHPNFPKSNLDTPFGSILSDGTAFKTHSGSCRHACLQHSSPMKRDERRSIYVTSCQYCMRVGPAQVMRPAHAAQRNHIRVCDIHEFSCPAANLVAQLWRCLDACYCTQQVVWWGCCLQRSWCSPCTSTTFTGSIHTSPHQRCPGK